MNRKPDATSPEETFQESLQQLRPAQQPLDAKQIFYQAGFQAGQASASRPFVQPLTLVAAMLATAIITVPLGYHAGASRDSVVQQPASDGEATVPIASPPSQVAPETDHDVPGERAREHPDEAKPILVDAPPRSEPRNEIAWGWFNTDELSLTQQVARLLAMNSATSVGTSTLPQRGTLTAMHGRFPSDVILAENNELPLAMELGSQSSFDALNPQANEVRDLTQQRLKELALETEVIR